MNVLHLDNAGSGRLSFTEGGEMRRLSLRRGDLYRLEEGSIFFLQSNLEAEREKLRVYAIFANNDNIQVWVSKKAPHCLL